MYKALKEGWYPLADLSEKYGKDKRNMIKILDRIENKEKIGNNWLVKESEFVENIKTDIEYEVNDMEMIDNLIEDYTDKLSTEITSEDVRQKFILDYNKNIDKVVEIFIGWSMKAGIPFPSELYKFLKGENADYVKFKLITSLWNTTLK